MEERIMLDEFDESGVSVKKQKYISVDGVTYPIGEPHRRAYVNSERGRFELASELAEPYFSTVMALWGDTPTVLEPPPDDHAQEGQ